MSDLLERLYKLDSQHDIVDEMKKLDKDEAYQLLEEVIPVCEQWLALRIAPNNDIGIVARHQLIRACVEKFHPLSTNSLNT